MTLGTVEAAQAVAVVPWIDRACIVVPAYDAEKKLGRVITDLRAALPELADDIFVIDDGSRDGTAAVAVRAGCEVVSHGRNRGKGSALVTGLATARARGYEVALTVDADGQHPADQARSVLLAAADPNALVLGIRALAGAGAPRKNQISNGISNFFISRFAGKPLHDTQCGLRRYPIATTLSLAARGQGYDFEAEVLLRAVWSGVAVVEQPIVVLYPDDRVTHFHVARDPWRIVRTVVAALAERRR
jgi:glycosyltransferase involved in cell wall biosynthesis